MDGLTFTNQLLIDGNLVARLIFHNIK